MLVAAAIGGVVAIASLNLVVDPYLVWGWSWPGINHYKPWLHHGGVSQFAAWVRRPRTIVVGASQVAVGFDPASPVLREWGSTFLAVEVVSRLPFAQDTVSAAIRGGRLQRAIVELDPRHFRPCPRPLPESGSGRSAAAVLAHILLIPAVRPSLRVLRTNLWGSAEATAGEILQQPSGLVRWPRSPPEEIERNAPAVADAIFGYGWQPPCAGGAPQARPFDELDALAQLSRSNDVRLILFFGPVHPELLLAMHRQGYWPILEDLKRQLAAFASRSGLDIWDFSTVALDPDRRSYAAEFYDPLHFAPRLGEAILARLRGDGGDLGDLLLSSTFDRISARDRQRLESSTRQSAR
jgi:hypothetical protein